MQHPLEEHRAIAQAVLKEDGEAAQATMSSHITIGGKNFAFVSHIPEAFLALGN